LCDQSLATKKKLMAQRKKLSERNKFHWEGGFSPTNGFFAANCDFFTPEISRVEIWVQNSIGNSTY
jgi:hypothetical protein